jgi:hypothetical protein
MIRHAIDEATNRKLFELEIASDFWKCSEVLSSIVSAFEATEDTHLRYEQGAAYLRLAVYYLLCKDEDRYELYHSQACRILPKLDVLALSAQWLDRNGYTPNKLHELCETFFKMIDENYGRRDSTSQVYVELMSELQAKYRK